MKTRVLYVSRYSMTDRNGGGQISGTKVTYLDSRSVQQKDAIGQAALTINGDYRLFDAFNGYKLPGFFDVEFSARPDSRGRPVLSISSVRPCSESAESDGLENMENQINYELQEMV
jgi:hypothetical protein